MVGGQDDREFVEDLKAVHEGLLKRLAEGSVDYQHDAMEREELDLQIRVGSQHKH